MPDLPRIFARPQVPEVQLPRPPAGAYGQEIWGQIAQVAQQIQAGADEAEIIKLGGEGTEALKTALSELNQNYVDPEEYNNQQGQIDRVYKETLAKASNTNVRKRLEAHLSDNYASARRLFGIQYWEKKRDKGLVDMESSLKQFSRAAIDEPNEENRKAILTQGLDLLVEMRKRNYLNSDKARQIGEDFYSDAVIGRAVREAENGNGYKILRDIYRGGYGDLTEKKREQLKNTITGALGDLKKLDEREKEVAKQELEQDLITMDLAGAPKPEMFARMAKSANALTGGEYRAWRNFVEADERREAKDSPEQIGNAEELRAELRATGYLQSNLTRLLDRARQMRSNNLLGRDGYLKFTNDIEAARQYQRREARIEGKGEKEDSFSSAVTALNKMFSPVQQKSATLRTYQNELTNRAGIGAPPDRREKPADVFKDIQQRILRKREQDAKEAKERQRAKAEQEKGGLPPAELDRLKARYTK